MVSALYLKPLSTAFGAFTMPFEVSCLLWERVADTLAASGGAEVEVIDRRTLGLGAREGGRHVLAAHEAARRRDVHRHVLRRGRVEGHAVVDAGGRLQRHPRLGLPLCACRLDTRASCVACLRTLLTLTGAAARGERRLRRFRRG